MNRTRTFAVALVAGAALELAIGSPAHAQAFAHWPKQCRSDLGRLCRDAAKDEDKAILTCLRDNEQKLGPACRKLLQSYGHVPESPGKRR